MQKFLLPFQGKVATAMTKENRSIGVSMRPTVQPNNANSITANPNERIASTSNTSTVNVQSNSRKRPSTTSSNNDESEQSAKMMRLIGNDFHTISAHDLFRQIQIKNNIEPNEISKKNVQQQTVDKPKTVDLRKEMRLLSGNVGDILNFVKRFPTLNTIYEVFANIFKIENARKAGERTMLLRNAGGQGPIIQAVFYEIDYKMCEVQVGDAVRVVGKFVNSSRLHIYKISVIIDTSMSKVLQSRLNAIGTFVLSGQH